MSFPNSNGALDATRDELLKLVVDGLKMQAYLDNNQTVILHTVTKHEVTSFAERVPVHRFNASIVMKDGAEYKVDVLLTQVGPNYYAGSVMLIPVQ